MPLGIGTRSGIASQPVADFRISCPVAMPLGIGTPEGTSLVALPGSLRNSDTFSVKLMLNVKFTAEAGS